MIAVALFGATATAQAGTDHWFSGTLGSGSGYASFSTNALTYIEATGNHNGFCVAKDASSGFASATKTTSGPRTCSSSGGFASRTENGAGGYAPWVDNNTGIDIDFASSTHASF